MHEALLLPNSEVNEAYRDVAQISGELAMLDARVETRRADIALIFDYESDWAWKIEPQGRDFSYYELVLHVYRALRRAGLSVDIGPPVPETVLDRKLVLAPGLFTASDAFVEGLSQSPAQVLLGPRSGSKTANFQIPPELPPGALRRLIDVRVQRAESLRPDAIIPAEIGHFERWREFLILGDGVETAMASYDDECALAHRSRFHYLAGWPNDALLDAVLTRLFALAAIERVSLPPDIRLRDNGGLRYLFNYGQEPADISSLVGDAALLLGEKLLPPCGVAAFAISPRK